MSNYDETAYGLSKVKQNGLLRRTLFHEPVDTSMVIALYSMCK